jgi:hypothetical protein
VSGAGRLTRWWRPLAVLLVVLGVWVMVVPFSRVIPGGDIREFGRAITPQVACGSPVVAAFRGDDDTLLLPDAPGGEVVVVDPEGFCRSRGQFRLAFGALLLVVGAVAVVVGPPAARRGRSRTGSEQT